MRTINYYGKDFNRNRLGWGDTDCGPGETPDTGDRVEVVAINGDQILRCLGTATADGIALDAEEEKRR